MNLVPKKNGHLVLNNEALASLPEAIAEAHEHAHSCYDKAMERRRKFFGSLFTSPQQDEFAERLRAIARAVDELTSYLVYRAGYTEHMRAGFAAKMALKREHQKLIQDLTKSGNVRYDSLPLTSNDESLYRSIDEGVNHVNELDARALGLIATHNDLVRSLTHFCSQHSFAIPKGQPLPREIYL